MLRPRARLSAVLVCVAVLGALAAGCGGSDSSSGSEAAPPADSTAATGAAAETSATTGTAAGADPAACEGATLSFIGLAGEEGDKELADWRQSLGMDLQVNNTADWGQLIGAIKVGQEHDLATIPVHQAQRMIATGILQPIDTSKLANWNDVLPALRDTPLLRGEDGQVYGVPIAWGDGPYVYAPDRVDTPPTSVTELLAPEWKGRFTLFDDPALPFFTFAQALGFTDAPLLTPEQLDQVKAEAKKLVENAAAFQASYQDATDRLVAGDVDLAFGGWEGMLPQAEAKGVTLDYAFVTEGKGGGWWDGLAIPSTATNPECALAYIDQMISPDTQAAVATNLVSGTVNAKAIDQVGEEAQIYDYGLLQSETPGIEFVNVIPPDDAPEGYASYQDWLDAWQELKAS